MEAITVTVNVTAECISEGQQCNGRWCPIAHAFRAIGFQHLDVNGDGVYATRKSDSQRFDFALPQEAKHFIWEFDSMRDAVQPFTFECVGKPKDLDY